MTDGGGVILDEETLDKPYGWVFFYQSRAWVETRSPEHLYGGNAPVIFNRVSGTYSVTGTAFATEHYLAEYEATLPPYQLAMPPQRRDRSNVSPPARSPTASESKILALAVFQTRILLSSYFGSQCTADINVRQAAQLAYALHNEALAVLEGRAFDVQGAVASVGAVDRMLGSEFQPLFDKVVQS